MTGLGILVDESLCFTLGQRSQCFPGYCTPAAGAMFKGGALRRAVPTIGFLSLFLLDLTLQWRLAHTHPCMSFLILCWLAISTVPQRVPFVEIRYQSICPGVSEEVSILPGLS